MNMCSPSRLLDLTNQSLLQDETSAMASLEPLPYSLKERGSDEEEKPFEGKRKTLSSQPSESSIHRRGVSPVTLRKKEEKSTDAGDETQGARHRRHSKTHPRRGKRPRARSPGDQPPPLRRSLVTSMRALSEAIYQDVAQVWAQQAQAPLTWEELRVLAQLRGSLYTAAQTFYTMATQAAYVFPAEGWLNPDPLPGSRDPAQE